MSTKIRDRHWYGAAAAACAICCAPPLLALLGIAGVGAAATITTIAVAGLAFGLVVLTASLLGLWARSRRARTTAHGCADPGPVDVSIGAAPDHTH